jgi:hypothetical protein
MFEKRVLSRIFVPKKEEVAGGCRRLHNELHNLCASPDIIKVIKSRRLRWADHVPRMEEMRNSYRIWVGKFRGRDHSEDVEVYGKIIIYRIVGK